MRDPVQAWIVFSGKADLPWLKILKPGFRHCYLLLSDGKRWITLDPLSSYMEVLVHDTPPDFDVPGWLRMRGHRVVSADVDRPQKCAPFALFSCVEAVKRSIGLHDWRIITPWQLYKYLRGCPR